MTGFNSKRQAALDKEIVRAEIERLKAQLAQPEQKPVEDVMAYHSDGTRTVRIAPKRPWVGLTDDEVYKIAFTLEGEHWKKIADAIEAKLKEKNT